MYLGAGARGRLDEAVSEVATGIAPVVGDDFFQSLVVLLGKTLAVDHVFIAERDWVDHDRVHTVAMASRAMPVEHGPFVLGGSASEVVLDQGTLTVPARVRREFPDDSLLEELAAESFCGRRLTDAAGVSTGLLGVVHGSAMPDAVFAESLIARFSLRVAAELERKRTETLLRDSEGRLRSLVDSAPVGIFEIDREGRLLSVNAESRRLAGDSTDVIGKRYLDTVADWDRARVADLVEQSFEGRLCQFEYASTAGERRRIFSATLIPLRGSDGVATKLLGYTQDITARKYSEERLIHRADHDSLTGLPNRGLFMDRLRSALARARRNGQRLALLYADLNQFKPVNDELGHQTGDRVLRLVAQRLRSAVREVDTVARIGGDEFAVILEAVSDVADASAVEAKIAETLGEPFFLDGHVINVSASTGIAIYPDDGDDMDALLQQADSQMYRAKRIGPSRASGSGESFR